LGEVENKKRKIILPASKLFLLVKLLRTRSKQVSDPKVKHNLLVKSIAYNSLLESGIDKMIDQLSEDVKPKCGT
jgi:hypothetical protein